jgi:hypothetical protein
MSYTFKENLNMFEKAVCTKSTPLNKLSLSSIGIGWKIAIIFVLVWAIVTTCVNLAAYAKILKEPDNEQNLSSSWCIAMLIFNGCLLIVSFLLIIVIGMSFKKESDAKKAVGNVVDAAKGQGAAEGAAVGAVAALQSAAPDVAKAAGDNAATAVMNITGDNTTAEAAGRAAYAAALNTANSSQTTAAATSAAVNVTSAAVSNGVLDNAAAAVATSTASATGVPAIRGSLGALVSLSLIHI